MEVEHARMQSADLTVTLPADMQISLPEYTDGSEVRREEVLSWNRYPAQGLVEFLALVVGDTEAVRQLAQDIESFRTIETMALDDDRSYVYVQMDAQDASPALYSVFDEPGLVVVPPIVYETPQVVHVTVVGSGDAFSGLLDAFPPAVEVDVERVSDHQYWAGTLGERLTARQFEALDAAQTLGYYDQPRDCSLAAVADALDCSRSAASTLLRNAEARLVETVLRS